MKPEEISVSSEMFDAVLQQCCTLVAPHYARDLNVGDRVLLKEWRRQGHFHTGRSSLVKITSIGDVFVDDDLRNSFAPIDFIILEQTRRSSSND